MNRQRPTSVDGFIPRRRYSGAPTSHTRHADYTGLRESSETSNLTHASEDREAKGMALQPEHTQQGLHRSELDDALGAIEQPEQAGKKKRRAPLSKKKLIKRIAIVLGVIILLIAGYLIVKTIMASASVFKGDIFGLVQSEPLKQDAGGRSNILVFGTSEDDANHDAPWLTDSIMVLSVNQTTKDAYMVSIPRDLEVQYGQACMPGYSGKINVVYGCNYEDGKNEEAGADALRKKVSEVTGLEIPYYAHVNYSVVRDIVKALGTITVDIQGSGGAPGIMDSNFDWKCKGGDQYASLATMQKICPPNGHFIDYPNGPAKLDAEHALYLAQARGDREPTYGLGNSNFDREQNQQKIIVAIKDKALSTGTLTDIGKVSGLIDAVGKNLRTNFATKEIRTLMSLAEDIPNDAIVRINLLDEKLLTASAQPVAGQYAFADLQAFIKKKLYATGIAKEDPHVMVLNGSGLAGAAQKEADALELLGMTIDAVGNAPDESYTENIVYQVGEAKPKTAAKLTELYGVKPEVIKSIPGVTLGEDTDYVIIHVKSESADQ